jgi:hypothetical protein
MYSKESVARFIQQEIVRPSKQWISHIIDGNQEKDEVILRTDKFVLLPDTERVNRYYRAQNPVNHSGTVANSRGGGGHLVHTGYHHRDPQKRVLNWLSIVHDRGLRTLRDLRGQHVPMLKRMLKACMNAIERHTGIPRDQVMAYVHYPPSVYQLHVHFSFPYGQYCHRDTYRVHSLSSIINNLEIDPEYYAKATLHLALYKQSLHYAALTSNSPPSSPSVRVTPPLHDNEPPSKDQDSEEKLQGVDKDCCRE